MPNAETIGAAALTLFALVGLVGLVWGRRSRGQRSGGPHLVGTVGQIYIYPIKSCHGIKVDSAECTALGPKHGIMGDRTFMVRSEKRKNFVSAIDYPRLVRVEPSFPDDEHVRLSAPEMEPLLVYLGDVEKGPVITTSYDGMEMQGYDCGDACVEWFEKYIGKPGLHLIYFGSGSLKPTKSSDLNRIGHMMRDTDVLAYSNKTSYMLMSSTSMNELNRQLKELTLPITNFRPNFVVDGCKPFDEENWSSVQLGETVQIKVLKLCERCPLVNVHAETGIRNQSEPLKTLRSYNPCRDENLIQLSGGPKGIMGLNAGLDVTGIVRTGDPVYAFYK